MTQEYLLFNIIILAGPLFLSFEKKVRFAQKWKYALPSILVVLAPFVIWDILVTGKHWWFNTNYTSGFKILELPIEEWLFFITVPFACLFIWEIFSTLLPRTDFPFAKFFTWLLLPLFFLGFYFVIIAKYYTGIVIIVFSITLLIDILLKTNVLRDKRVWFFMLIILALTLVFNFYLTARPVVLYETSVLLNFYIFTIPIEDFIYGLSLILLNVIVYKKFKGNS